MNKQAIDPRFPHTGQTHAGQTDTEELSIHPVEWLLYGLGALIAVALPFLLIRLNVPFIHLMDEVYHPIVLLQLYVFSASAVLVVALIGKLWQQRQSEWQRVLPFVLGILVAFHVLALMRHHDARSWDYICYEEAARAIVSGANPYGHCYIYFPTPAQAMATIATFATWLTAGNTAQFTGVDAAQESTVALWNLVFYLYEATQLLLVILAYTLCYRLARLLGLQRVVASMVITALFVFNNPLLATLKHNQVNLWVLDLILLAILGIQRYPIVSGLFVAIGAHIKLYPLALLLPWTLKRQWRGLFSAGLGMIAILLLQTSGGRDLTLWRQFLAFADSFPRGTFFRDNSLHSLIYNTLGHLKWIIGDSDYPANERYVSGLVLVGMGFLGLLYLWRFVQREQLARLPKPSNSAPTTVPRLFSPNWAMAAKSNTLMGHTMDALILALIASPVVWEHHYLLAMPIVIWGIAQARTERQFALIGVSSFLIFVLPTFDIYPFSYHRLAGLLLLMGTLSPMWLAAQMDDTPKRRREQQQPLTVAALWGARQKIEVENCPAERLGEGQDAHPQGVA